MEPPRDEEELSRRLGRLAGHRLGAIAEAHGVAVPPDLRRHKGWVGTLLERALGATAASRAEPDFPHLGVELKTIPIDARGRPLESCFVASLDLAAVHHAWESSPVRKKLARVAWVAVEAAPSIPLPSRRLGASLLWSPSPREQETLRADYEDLVELIGEGFTVTAHRGTWLQLRPKGRDAAALRRSVGFDGAAALTAPRAFYLRRSFTTALLAQHFTSRTS